MKSFNILASLLLLGVPLTSYAQECTEQSDCRDDEECLLYATPVLCMVDEEGNEVCEEPGEPWGECVPTPIDCVEDSDCPSHLICGSSGHGRDEPGATSSGSSGSSGSAESPGSPESSDEFIEEDSQPVPPCEGEDCGDPLPEPEVEEGPTQCVYDHIECEAASDCPANFECHIYEGEEDCAVSNVAVDCPEDDVDCEPFVEEEVDCGDVEPISYGYCQPVEIECESDEMCPSDWTCRQQELYHNSCGVYGASDQHMFCGKKRARVSPFFWSCYEKCRDDLCRSS